MLPALFQLLMVAGNPWQPLACVTSIQSLPPSPHGLCVCSCLYSAFSLCLCPNSPLISSPVMGFRAHPTPLRLQLNLITSTETLFPNKAPFWGSRWHQFGGTPFNPAHTLPSTLRGQQAQPLLPYARDASAVVSDFAFLPLAEAQSHVWC